ncbi:thrombomodulin-like [Poecilia formosa]|nr:PREDICTED: thrombomodulin-like [Poecilia formosa]
MNVAAGLFVPMLVFLLGKAAGAERTSGYCIGNACFTLFRDPSTFSSAQQLCRDQNSHLMTVRTSVSSDVLTVLLGNLTGSFWIGLHRLSGCPNPSEALRGFQWVTKDTESDFVNWEPDFDYSCAAARCVSVNGDENFKWRQTPCDQPAAGFLCENSFVDPCTNLPHAAEQSVRYWTPYGFEVEDVQSSTLPSGSIATLFPSKTKYICGTSKKWLRAPWNCEINEGGCEHKCAMDPSNTPICYCPQGKTVSTANRISCQAEGTDDPCAALHCQQACYEAGGRHQCGCDHGLQLAADGRTCVDFDECADERQCPEENFKCVNTPRGYTCVCESGYRLVGGACVDTDECTLAPCEHECTNSRGSYVCSCFKGYRVDEKDPHKCRLHCGEQMCPAECDPNNNFQCFCPDGYLLEERGGSSFCIDINECDSNYCDQECRNTYGGYVCSCKPGFKLVGEDQCREVDDEESSTLSIPTSPTHPDPTRRPSAVTAGGLVGIIVSTVFIIVLAVFATHVLLLRRGKKEESAAGALKEAEEDMHGLQRLSDSRRDKVV